MTEASSRSGPTTRADMELGQSKIGWSVPHAVEQRVTGRAQYPNHFRPARVADGSVCAVSLFARAMGKLKNTGFAACLAGHRCVRVTVPEPTQIRVRWQLRLGSLPIHSFAIWISFMKFSDRPRLSCATAFIRADAFLIGVLGRVKRATALTAFAWFVSILRCFRPAVGSPAPLRAEATGPPAERIFVAAMIASALHRIDKVTFLMCGLHEEMGLP
jgi:hypothetical protein